ncbi:TetR family transcriptional regulator [Mycobacterium sp. MYCO198283]|uniref:TetR family transcriptional regulator n=1 Tax=Mycobacterium sp. MYCO198283 TaxID=2883505 RepID=UPI001E608F48|nr:TetR family transcriptional regulator [Mycobacterium sp. MYCO198283]MCG5430837.1 TetR family transcriptional regulator [Mycobacterium sp. MYCO198283]
MPRPRLHDPDVILDAAESLAASAGVGAVTTRAVAAAAGVSNGAIYHEFGSRGALLGHTWVRAARRFLDLQAGLVDAHRGDSTDPADVIVAAADAPAVFAERYPQSARLLVDVPRHQLVGDDPAASAALADLDRELLALLVRLAEVAWGRRDSAAVDVVTICVVDLPTAILLSRNRIGSPVARRQLVAAVRAVVAVGPPPKRRRNDEH